MNLSHDAEEYIRRHTGPDGPHRDVIISAALERYARILARALPELPPDTWERVFSYMRDTAPSLWPALIGGDQAATLAAIDLYERHTNGAHTPELESGITATWESYPGGNKEERTS